MIFEIGTNADGELRIRMVCETERDREVLLGNPTFKQVTRTTGTDDYLDCTFRVEYSGEAECVRCGEELTPATDKSKVIYCCGQQYDRVNGVWVHAGDDLEDYEDDDDFE